MTKQIQKIAIVGAGLMGHGIALTFAKANYEVTVTDPSLGALNSLHARIEDSMSSIDIERDDINAALDNISVEQEIGVAVRGTDLVIEAGPENLEVKRKIFAEVEASVSDDCILTSNTSVLPITKIMSELSIKSRAVGTHWWNPPHLVPLVEVIRTQWSDEKVLSQVTDVLLALGKKPVRVDKDIPGFVGNRLQHALWREAISLVEHDVCSAEAVDTVVKASFGRRLAVLGPLENADLVGTDLTLDIHETVLSDLDARAHPSPYLKSLVEAGKLGMKSGEGFRTWKDDEPEQLRNRVAQHLKAQNTIENN